MVDTRPSIVKETNQGANLSNDDKKGNVLSELRFWAFESISKELSGLFFEQREDEREDVVGYYLISFCGGVGSVGLHHAVYAEDALQ
jgi:hypothetical protein